MKNDQEADLRTKLYNAALKAKFTEYEALDISAAEGRAIGWAAIANAYRVRRMNPHHHNDVFLALLELWTYKDRLAFGDLANATSKDADWNGEEDWNRNDDKTRLISVKGIVGENAVTLEDGRAVYSLIQEPLMRGESVVLSFNGVSVIGLPFLNAGVGQLLATYPVDDLNNRLFVTQISSLGNELLHRVMKNAEKQFEAKPKLDEFNPY